MMKAFWESKPLKELNAEEWESLCDGCGRCCLVKLEDSDTGEISYTNVTCKLLDIESCRCNDYANRLQRVPTCFVLDAETIHSYSYLPPTCAYRLLAENKPLSSWHPLVSGQPDSVHTAGISVQGKVVSESYTAEAELEDHIVSWPLESD